MIPHSLRRRFAPQCAHYPQQLIVCALIFALCVALVVPTRRATAQGGCQVECTTNVPAAAAVNTPVNFASTSTAAACSGALNYQWDFGDGTARATDQSTAHTYAVPGTYTWRYAASAASGVTTIETIAGGYGEGVEARRAPFATPVAIARDSQGRGIYVADQATAGYFVRFINTSNAAVTIAGKVIQPGTNRVLTDDSGFPVYQNQTNRNPEELAITAAGLATSADGNLLYISDAPNSTIWALNVSGSVQSVFNDPLSPGNISTIARAQGSELGGIAVHPTTGEVYFVDGNVVRKVLTNVQTEPVAGNGAPTTPSQRFPDTPTDAKQVPLLTPRDIAFDAAGNLYITDSGHARVVYLEPTGILVLSRQFETMNTFNPYPAGLAIFNNNVYVALGNRQTIIRLGAAETIIAGAENTSCDYTTSQCGDGGTVAEARFNLQESSSAPPLVGLEADANGLYVLDQGKTGRGRVRYLNLSGTVTLAGTTVDAGRVATIAGSGLVAPFDGGPAQGAILAGATGVATDAQGNLWIADTFRHAIRFVNRGRAPLTLFAGTPAEVTVLPGQIVTINKDTGPGLTDNTTVNQAGFDTPQGLFITNRGVFVVDAKKGPAIDQRRTGSLRFINTSDAVVVFYSGSSSPISVMPGFIATIAGGNPGVSGIGNGEFALRAKLLAPSDVVVNPTTGDIYLADVGNEAVRRINGSTGVVSSLSLPASQYTGLGLDANGRLYIADFEGDQVLRETAAGAGTFASMIATPISRPRDVAVDAQGNAYVPQGRFNSTANERKIVQITPGGALNVIAGTTEGFSGDGGPAINAKLGLDPADIVTGTVGGAGSAFPATTNIVLGANGEIIFADSHNNRLRRIAAEVTTCTQTGTITITGSHPIPALSRLTPSLALLNRPFTLTAIGTGFGPASKVRWNGEERPTTYVSSTQLLAAIPATDVTETGTAQVSVVSPAPGGGPSNPLSITIARFNLLPSLTTLNPTTAAIGTAITLTVNGQNFSPNSVVRWNGQDRPTTYLSLNTLRAQIPASDLASAGTANVTVFSPEPGGGISNPASFRITAINLVPTLITTPSPVIPVGGTALAITVGGSNFAFNSVARLNGQDRQTTFISSTQLMVILTMADLAQPGILDLTIYTPPPGGGVSAVLKIFVGRSAFTVSAASFANAAIAPEAIAALFGTALAAGTEAATTAPLPTTLGNATVTIRDVDGVERLAPLFFVSPSQINYLVPAGTAPGVAQVVVRNGSNITGVGAIIVAAVGPAFFSANANGQGVVAGVALRIKADGAQVFEPLAEYNAAQGRFVPVPLELGASTEEVFLILFGTGLRNRSDLSNVRVRIGGVETPVLFAGAAPGFTGLDQLNLQLPRSLAGRGVADIVVTVDGRQANTVQVTIK